ncbi:YesL family protein [Carnobacterium gallinarum]|uniref:YesL family protein n=1 Tax=Carnobacterium gallinarum TaxID=2749 RepID=UPI00054E05A6|nr:DUF624 domain-containing protein [Carnobacterium gallinarum]
MGKKDLNQINYSLGEWLVKGVTLQFLFIFYTVRGGIFLGFFPALTSTFAVIYQFMLGENNDLDYRSLFKRYYHKQFKESNLLGLFIIGVGAFLWLDLQISATYLKISMLHVLLLFFFVTYIATVLYLFPIYIRYQLSPILTIRQAFIVSFSSIIETCALFLGIGLVSLLGVALPIVFIGASIPLLVWPINWFAIQACTKLEKKIQSQ